MKVLLLLVLLTLTGCSSISKKDQKTIDKIAEQQVLVMKVTLMQEESFDKLQHEVEELKKQILSDRFHTHQHQ